MVARKERRWVAPTVARRVLTMAGLRAGNLVASRAESWADLKEYPRVARWEPSMAVLLGSSWADRTVGHWAASRAGLRAAS
jgi:hypothetical protein